MSNPSDLLKKQGYYPCLFFICKHNANHRHGCDHCHKYMIEGEEQVLVAYYKNTYDAADGDHADLVAYDIICRLCHPGVIDKGWHYAEPSTNVKVV